MEKFFKISAPCDRFKFFQNTMLLFVLQLVFALSFWILTTYVAGIKSILWLTPVFLVFVELPLLYLYFVQTARRIYSILGVFRLSILISTLVFIFLVAGLVYFPILAVLVYTALLLLPERDLNE